MKKSGVRWSVSGGQGILTIRSWVKSDRFDRIWNLVMADLVNGMPANDNCMPNHDLALAAQSDKRCTIRDSHPKIIWEHFGSKKASKRAVSPL